MSIELIPVSDDEADQQIVDASALGASVSGLATRFGKTPREIMVVLDRCLPKVDQAYKRRAVALSAMRLDRLTERYQKAAEDGDVEAGNLCIRIEDQRRALLGNCGSGWDPVQLLNAVNEIGRAHV